MWLSAAVWPDTVGFPAPCAAACSGMRPAPHLSSSLARQLPWEAVSLSASCSLLWSTPSGHSQSAFSFLHFTQCVGQPVLACVPLRGFPQVLQCAGTPAPPLRALKSRQRYARNAGSHCACNDKDVTCRQLLIVTPLHL